MPKPLLAITVMFVYALACTTAPAAPSIGVNATVDQRVAEIMGQATAEALAIEPTPSATPMPYSPTRSDFNIAVQPGPDVVSPSILHDFYKTIVLDRFADFAAGYIAIACTNDFQLNAKDFRYYVSNSGIAYRKDVRSSTPELLRAAHDDPSNSCLRPLFYPVTGEDDAIVVAFVKSLLSQLSVFDYSGTVATARERVIRRDIHDWLGNDTSPREPFILWWCEEGFFSDACDIEETEEEKRQRLSGFLTPTPVS